jgi:mutator family transposase
VSAALQEVFNADDHKQARERATAVIEQLTPAAPKVADAEPDLLAFYRFPPEHQTKLRSTNPLERVNREIGRRTDVVGIFPNDAALIRLAGMLLIEQTTNGSSRVATCPKNPWPPRRPRKPNSHPPPTRKPSNTNWKRKGKGNGKGGHRPRRLRADLTDDHELHHKPRLD